MLEFMIAWGIIAFFLFVVLGGVSAIVGTGTDNDEDKRMSRLFALGAFAGLIWPLVLVFGVVYVLVWTGTQGAKALWNLKGWRLT